MDIGTADRVVSIADRLRIFHDDEGNRYVDGNMINQDVLLGSFVDDVNTNKEGSDPIEVY